MSFNLPPLSEEEKERKAEADDGKVFSFSLGRYKRNFGAHWSIDEFCMLGITSSCGEKKIKRVD